MVDSVGSSVVYVSCAESREIDVFRLDTTTGRLSHGGPVAVPGTTEPSPYSLPLAVSPDRRFMFAALRTQPYPVSSYSIDPEDGSLTHLCIARLEDTLSYITTDRTGRWLFGASVFGGKILVNAIGTDGLVQGTARQVLPGQTRVHAVLTDPSNRFAFAALLGGDKVTQFRFDADEGRLQANVPDSLVARPGSGPRHLKWHPTRSDLYIINEYDGTIDVCSMDPRGGTLEQRQSVRVTAEDFVGEPSAADIQVTPDGRFLYGSERTSSTIFAFQIDPQTGSLTPRGSTPTEPVPRGFAIDPAGRFLIAAGIESHRIAVFAIDATDGRLEPIGTYPTGRMPNWVEILTPPNQ